MRKLSILLVGFLLAAPLGLATGCEDQTSSRKVEVETSHRDGSGSKTEIKEKKVVEPDGDTKTTIEKKTERHD